MLTNFKTQLIKKEQLVSHVFLFRFQLLEPKEINFKAGQYLMLKINDQRRLYSICSPDFIKDYLELVVEVIKGGLGSNYFDNLKVGDRVGFQGPAGMFTLKENNKPKIFLATGTGIAPIRSMIYSVVSNQSSVLSKNKNKLTTDNRLLKTVLFWGLRTRKDVCFLEEFRQLSESANWRTNFHFKICLSREKDLVDLDSRYFMLGHINDGLLGFLSQLRITCPPVADTPSVCRRANYGLLNDFEYYLCGSREVVSSMVTFLQEQGIKKENIFFEKF